MPRDYEQLDAAFHRRIALAARNALFLALFDSMLAAIDRGAWHGVRETAHCSKNKDTFSRFHKCLVEAIAGRAPDKAAETMFAHLCRVRDHLLGATYPQSIAARMETS
jgi:DNA-binding FadR family transcriptional regulator